MLTDTHIVGVPGVSFSLTFELKKRAGGLQQTQTLGELG